MANVFVRDTAGAYSLGRGQSSWPASVYMVYDSRQQLIESTLDQVAQCMVGEVSSAYEHYMAPRQYVDLRDKRKATWPAMLTGQGSLGGRQGRILPMAATLETFC